MTLLTDVSVGKKANTSISEHKLSSVQFFIVAKECSEQQHVPGFVFKAHLVRVILLFSECFILRKKRTQLCSLNKDP